MGYLKEKMNADLLRYGLSLETCKRYLYYVESYVRHFNCSPKQLGSTDIEAWLDHLKLRENRSVSFCQNALVGLKFLYFVTLKSPEVVACFIPPTKLQDTEAPIPLSKSDLRRLFDGLPSELHRTILAVSLGGGLHIGEACSLQTGDIDSLRMFIRIPQTISSNSVWPKFVQLHQKTLSTLRQWWRYARVQGDILFDMESAGLSSVSMHQALHSAAESCGFDTTAIDKKVRYSFFIHRLSVAKNYREVSHILRCTSYRPATNILTQTQVSSFDTSASLQGGRI